MKIYIDSDYKCHVTDDGIRRAFDLQFFDGKCVEFVEGYRYVPEGETWTRSDGEVFCGTMITPWRTYNTIYRSQLEYEIEQYKAALSEIEIALGVTS